MVGSNIKEHPMAINWNIIAPPSSELDLTNSEAVYAYISANKPDLVIHAAGHVGGIQANTAQPVVFLERNAAIGRNIIMAAYNAGVRSLLNIASTCMYPRACENPLREDMLLTGALEPTNEGYALAKIMATRLCQYISREDENMLYRTIIPCNLFGRYDKFNPRNSHLLPAIIHKIHLAKLNNDPSVEIWGDGEARREFMYAGDISDAIMKAASNMDALPDLMNCGIGYDHTINSYYKAVADVLGWYGEFKYDLSKPVGMNQKLCATDRQLEWGWSAPTSLSDGIKATYDFYLNEFIE